MWEDQSPSRGESIRYEYQTNRTCFGEVQVMSDGGEQSARCGKEEAEVMVRTTTNLRDEEDGSGKGMARVRGNENPR
jgi:hypothetical protein